MTKRLTARQVIDRLTYGELPATEHGDPWGYAMGAHFDIAHALLDRPSPNGWPWIPSRWGFRPSPMLTRGLDGIEDAYVRQWISKVRTATLVRAGDILHRYEARLERAGRSY